MIDEELILRRDALYAIAGWEIPSTAIAALPAVTVGVKPLVWSQTYNNAGDLTDVWCADDPLFEHRWWAERADKMPKIEAKRTARILAALEPVVGRGHAAITADEFDKRSRGYMPAKGADHE